MRIGELENNNNFDGTTINNKNAVDYYENFLKEQVKTLENILTEHCDTDIDKRVVMSKIIAYQECYIQYLLIKK